MPIELKVPTVGESITEVQIGQWLKGEGEWADKDQPLVEIESDKATVELLAPQAGTVARVLKGQGQTANVGEVIGYLEASKDPHQPDAGLGGLDPPRARRGAQARDSSAVAPAPEQPPAELERAQQELRPARKDSARQEPRRETPPGEPRGEPARAEAPPPPAEPKEDQKAPRPAHVMPAARRALAEHGLRAEQVEASGPGGRLLKEDVERHVERSGDGRQAHATEPAVRPREAAAEREDEVVPMSPLRKRVAERLVEAQRVAALLTTFNEIDMSAVMSLRQQHKESFQERYGVKLGFMSFFVKAVIEALKETPQVNAEIRDTDIVYHNYFDIGIAVAGGKGLVVPVLRAADEMSFAEIEQAIADLAGRARQNKLKLNELEGGTFTISNGGVYGSLLSTPIVNPPQSGILGLHAIQDRPVARDGQVVIRPMMYVALTYDHRIVDGREAVLFLRHVKDCIEEPSRMLLEV